MVRGERGLDRDVWFYVIALIFALTFLIVAGGVYLWSG